MHLLNLFDYERVAQEKMPASAHAYYAGGVADNLTLRDNRAAFEQVKLRPRMLVDVSHISTETIINGKPVSMPVLIAPTAVNGLAHADAELGVARAAENAGIPQILSTFSNTAVEDVTATGVTTWFQLYMAKERHISQHMIARAEKAGCEALVLTVDAPVAGLRENLTRADFQFPPLNCPHFDPFPELDKGGSWGDFVRDHIDPSLTWDVLDWLQAQTDLPIWVKGILRGDDAKRAVDKGIAGIIVSNHGGRQLDTAIPSIEALPDVVEAVNGQAEILMDGGVRRGVDILKALALGAKGVLLGRPPLWGLAVNGEAGVSDVLNMIHREFENGMALCGCPTIAGIDSSLVHQ